MFNEVGITFAHVATSDPGRTMMAYLDHLITECAVNGKTCLQSLMACVILSKLSIQFAWKKQTVTNDISIFANIVYWTAVVLTGGDSFEEDTTQVGYILTTTKDMYGFPMSTKQLAILSNHDVRAQALGVEAIEVGHEENIPLSGGFTPTLSSIHMGEIKGGEELVNSLRDRLLEIIDESSVMPIVANTFKDINALLNEFTPATTKIVLSMVARSFRKVVSSSVNMPKASRRTLLRSIKNRASYPVRLQLSSHFESSTIQNSDNLDDIVADGSSKAELTRPSLTTAAERTLAAKSRRMEIRVTATSQRSPIP
eukprot:966086-Amphidinium_carterae.1